MWSFEEGCWEEGVASNEMVFSFQGLTELLAVAILWWGWWSRSWVQLCGSVGCGLLVCIVQFCKRSRCYYGAV